MHPKLNLSLLHGILNYRKSNHGCFTVPGVQAFESARLSIRMGLPAFLTITA